MEERMNELTKDPTRVSDALVAALIQATYEDDMAYYRKEGLEEGIADTMTLLLKTKFGELSQETISLISSCSLPELNHLTIHFYEIQCEEDIRLFLKMETQ